MEQAAKFAESTQILMNVSEFTDVSQATDTLISSVQAFEYTAETSMEVVDLLNTIGNNYAISTADLAQSLTKSSASLVAAGGDLAEAAALTATANAIVQDADAVGTALKTTSLRLRGTDVKVLEEEGVDSDGAVTSKSKLQSKVKALSGVDILTETGDYKSTYEILSQIADVWEDISNMDQAALLEMLAGKRNASVLAAILQAPETLKAAYEDAQNAEGSALEENEKYLDSIQGKIDQFNNAVQTLWSNILDDSVVKGAVEWVTKIIKSLDTTQGKILAIVKAVALLMAYKKVNPLDWISNLAQNFKTDGVATTLKNMGASLIGIRTVTKAVTAETIANTVATQANNTAEQQAILQKMGLTGATGALNAEKKEEVANNIALAVTNDQMTVQMGQQIAAMLGYTLSVDAAGKATVVLDKTTKSFMASNPVGWILLIVSALASLVPLLSLITSKTEKLTEEFNELKSELQDVQSEIDGINSELETTNDRMAELLAKDSLTFTEKEELNNLKKQNDELQRRLDLLDLEQKQKQQQAADNFVDTMEQSVNQDTYSLTGKRTWFDKWANTMDDGYNTVMSTDEYMDYLIGQYASEIEKQKDQEGREIDTWNETKADPKKYSQKIADMLKEWTTKADTLEYHKGDNLTDEQKKVNEWLDYVYNLQDKWAIASGGANAKTNAVNRIFNKDENSEISDSIDGYIEALRKGDTSAKSSIENIIKNNNALVEDLKASGLSVDEAVDYFTSFASELEFATLEGKIKEVSEAATKFEGLLKGGVLNIDGIDTGLVELFNEDGKIIQTKLSQVFQDTSDQTREDITHLLEGSYDQIKNGTVDIERLLSGFALKTTQQVLEIQNKILGEQNLELFPNLKDEINGIIDKFDEFSAAIGSVVDAMDTLEQARAEEAYSGSVSIETLENLMKYTDDYAQLVEIDETGAITLAKDAEKLLIEQRIQKIKTDAAAAVQTAQTNLEQAKYNAKAVNETGPVQQALTSATDALAGSWAYLGSIIGDITDGNFSGIFGRASEAYSKVTAGRDEKRTQVNVSVSDAEKSLSKALDQQKIANALTADNVKSKFSSDEASGGNKTKDDVKDDAFQKTMDYWENRISAKESEYDQVQNEIDRLESQGKKAGAEYYQEQIKLEDDKLGLLKSQKKDALAYLKSVKEGSDEWWDAAKIVNDIEQKIDDVTANIQGLNDAIADVNWYGIEEPLTRFDNHTDTLGNIRDLVAPNGEEDWFDDEGMWTEKGVTVAGTYVQEIEMDKQSLENTRDVLSKLTLPYEGNEEYYKSLKLGIDSEQDLYDKKEEYQKKEQEYVKDIQDNQQNIVDMYEAQIDAVEEYTQTLIDGYNDYIDSVKEALDAERDLYDFKKNIQKQSKDIAETERRIASLSGSTNAADIAERRKLEAQLYESRESLNDTYYDHAKDAQQQALEEEAAAYEETMNKFIEGLRTSLETAIQDMDTFMKGVYNAVILNAPTIIEEYGKLGIALDGAITDPWTAASKAIKKYQDGDGADLGLSAMNKWINEGGIFPTFKSGATDSLTSPWTAGQSAINAFKTSVDTQMSKVVTSVQTNVQTASSKLSELYKQIEDTAKKAASVGSGSTGGNYDPPYDPPDVPKTPSYKVTATLKTSAKTFTGIGQSNVEKAAKNSAEDNLARLVYKYYRDKGKTEEWIESTWLKSWEKNIKFKTTPVYAKGTTGTTRDAWAITDEPQFGDELVLVPGKNGNLSYMRKGTGVVPADLTANLMEWGQFSPDSMNFGGGVNVNMINNAVIKPNYDFNFDSLVHVDNCSQETLKDLEKMVDTKINDFSKQMNYSLKKFAR